jgi:hypothetical protein
MRRKIRDFIIEFGGYRCVCGGIMKGTFALTMSEERIQQNTSILKRASSNRSTEWETSKMVHNILVLLGILSRGCVTKEEG